MKARPSGAAPAGPAATDARIDADADHVAAISSAPGQRGHSQHAVDGVYPEAVAMRG